MSTLTPIPGKQSVGTRPPPSRLLAIFPGLGVFSAGGLKTFRYDLVASITLAAYVLPAGLGDASLAGLPPQAGLYACLFSGLIFWLFCSSKVTAVTVTSAISLLIGSTLMEMGINDPVRLWALAACTALLVSGIAFVAWVIRAGSLVNFISETVLVGFKCGVAVYLASTQLPKLFGFHGSHGNFWDRSYVFLTNLGKTNFLALTMGVVALAIIIAGKKLLKNKPVALFVMIAAIALTSALNLHERGVEVLGDIPAGLPPIGLPHVTLEDANTLLPLALACFMLGAVETAAIGRMFAIEKGYRLDANQEFLALAGANLAAGLGQGYPASGGMSQSLVNESAGARTPLSGLLSAIIILLVTVFLSDLLRNLPQPVLAAIVLAAVTGLFKVSALKRLWKFNRGEFIVAIAALLGVLTSGLLRGVVIGVILTVLLLMRRASRPHTTELGSVPNSHYFGDLVRHPENTRLPGVFVYRIDSSLLYFNIEHVRDSFIELLNSRTDDIRLAVFSMGTVPVVDLAGAEMLTELHHAMKTRGIDFRLAEAHGAVRDALRRAGFEEHYGRIIANQTISEVIGSAPTSTG